MGTTKPNWVSLISVKVNSQIQTMREFFGRIFTLSDLLPGARRRKLFRRLAQEIAKDLPKNCRVEAVARPDDRVQDVAARPDDRVQDDAGRPDDRVQDVAARPDDRAQDVAARPDDRVQDVAARPDDRVQVLLQGPMTGCKMLLQGPMTGCKMLQGKIQMGHCSWQSLVAGDDENPRTAGEKRTALSPT